MKIYKKLLVESKEKDYEGEMAISQLKNIVEDAQALLGMLKDDSQLPAWIQSKLTIAEHNLDASLDYMKSQKSSVNEALITPEKGETEQEFISRFMSDEESKKDFPENKQRVAVAFAQWNKK